jgi:hypothetical protein
MKFIFIKTNLFLMIYFFSFVGNGKTPQNNLCPCPGSNLISLKGAVKTSGIGVDRGKALDDAVKFAAYQVCRTQSPCADCADRRSSRSGTQCPTSSRLIGDLNPSLYSDLKCQDPAEANHSLIFCEGSVNFDSANLKVECSCGCERNNEGGYYSPVPDGEPI